jgi:uncharacterized membrane protein
MSITSSIRKSFWKGLAALLPGLLTFIILVIGIRLIHDWLGQYVNELIIWILMVVEGWDNDKASTWYAAHFLTPVGSIVAIIGLGLAAYLIGTFLGGSLMRLFEAWLVRLPIVRKIYPGAKQVSEFFFSEKALEFRRVVAVEFPRKGMWMVGFVTGGGLKELSDHTKEEMLSVFIPSTPAPVTGWVVIISSREVLDLKMSVDEALQFLISAGVVVPPAERVESLRVGLQMTHEEATALVESAEAKSKEQDGSTENDEIRGTNSESNDKKQ